MALDMKKVRQMDEDLHSSDSKFKYPKDLKNETDFRIAPPVPELEGSYCFELKQYFINKKPYISNSTFEGIDVIAEEIEEAKLQRDPDLDALLANAEKLNQRNTWLMPILLLDCDFDNNQVCTGYKVLGDKWHIFAANKMLTREINKEVTSRRTQPDITDPKKGFNLLFEKKGSGLQTEYFANAWTDRMEIDAKYYDPKIIPNVYLEAKKLQVSDDYLRAVIRNYLYGERFPTDEDKKAGKETAKDTDNSGRGRNKAQEETKGTKNTRTTTQRGGTKHEEAKPKSSGTSKRNLDDDINDLN